MWFPWKRKVVKFTTIIITVFFLVLVMRSHYRFAFQIELNKHTSNTYTTRKNVHKTNNQSNNIIDRNTKTDVQRIALNATNRELNNNVDKQYKTESKHVSPYTTSNHSIQSGDSNTIKDNFKFFIYDLPRALNMDISDCIGIRNKNCFDVSNEGFGSEMFRIGNNKEMSITDSNQFSLEVILHSKLKNNRLRTLDPYKADIFYIPAYMGLMSFCNRSQIPHLIEILHVFLTKSVFYQQGKPHFSSAAKIEREMIPYFHHDFTSTITYLGIEKEARYRKNARNVIVSPYPSYVHFIDNSVSFNTPYLSERDIFVLLPAGERRSNHDRGKLMDQFNVTTKLSYEEFKNIHGNQYSDMVLFYTNECSHHAIHDTIPWLIKSVFCLQPPGDSPTRKSFYDSILSGCIPVIFTENGENPYAFKQLFDYSKFSVIISFDKITKEYKNIFKILKEIDEQKLIDLHANLKKVAQHMQYSISDRQKSVEDDALRLIFTELSTKHHLPYDRKYVSQE